MEFTDFSKLRDALKRIGLYEFEVKLLNRLQLGDLEGNTGDTKNLILGESGIYKLEKGCLVKVILHITSIDKIWLEKNQKAIAALNQKKYDSKEFIRALHKYHFTTCTTIYDMFNTGRKSRYYMSQRIKGKFNYQVIDNSVCAYESRNQKLNVCRNCISALGKLTGKSYNSDDFDMNEIFDTAVVELSSAGHELECNAVPNIYATDWEMIATKAKKQVAWQCEECAVKLETDKKHLHCHHIDANRVNNLLSNLKVLCIKCHAEQPGHQHLRDFPQYQEYLDKYHAN